MNISFNWLRDYINTTLTPEEVAEVLTSIGLEVESVERVEPVPGGLRGVLVGEVLECTPHPDADRLRITRVNLGEGEPVQIVCGAPNVAAGQKVLVATIGAVLHPAGGEPLTIRKSKIRGAESHGMICAEDELGLGKSHDGILLLDSSLHAGTSALDALGLKTDYILCIGLTPNRTDAISHIGVARDLAAALQWMEGGHRASVAFQIPDTGALAAGTHPSPVSIDIRDTERCPRYSGLYIEGVQVGPSPEWLRERLAAIGQRPVNNIVDITNYVQHEIGQPLHAFDAGRISGGNVIVRTAHSGEVFQTLDGVERALSDEDLVIADANGPMCLAGVFGGLHSGVTESTTQLFLESAWFQPVSIRKSARRHGLNTDSSFRFERGTDPTAVPWALHRAAQLIVKIAGGVIPAQPLDHYPVPAVPAEVNLRLARVEMLIGSPIPSDRIRSILIALGCDILTETNRDMLVRVPLYRVEVTREADLIEEILRIYGYDNIGYPAAMRSALSEAPKPDADQVVERISDHLVALGFSEIMGMSMTKQKYADLSDDPAYSTDSSVALLNPLSSDLALMRQTLLYGGLQAIALNQNHRNPNLRFFEFGKEYRRGETGFEERKRLVLLVTGSRQPEGWNAPAAECSFSDLKGPVERILRIGGIKGVKTQGTSFTFLEDGLEWVRGKDVLVRAGNVASSVLAEFDLKTTVWFADFDFDRLVQSLPATAIVYKAPDKFPSVRRDLSLLLNRSVRFADIEASAFASEKKLLREVNLFDVYEGKNIAEGKKSYAVSFVMQDSEKTMTDQQVDGVMEKILLGLTDKLGASLRQ